jgi:hypothetical protein
MKQMSSTLSEDCTALYPILFIPAAVRAADLDKNNYGNTPCNSN